MSWLGKFAVLLWAWMLPSIAMAQARIEVEIGQLSQIDPFSVGFFDAATNTLPQNQWHGSHIDALTQLISETPIEGGPALFHQLVAQVLVRGGDAPQPNAPNSKLAITRLHALYGTGQLKALQHIIARTPGANQDPETAAILVNVFLLLGQTEQACSLGNKQGQARAAAFWLQLRAFCMAKAGNIAGAQLTADLADPSDARFINRIDRLTLPGAKPEKLNIQSALEFAMATMSGDQISPKDLSLPLQIAVAKTKNPAALSLAFSLYAKGYLPRGDLVRAMRRRANAIGKPTNEQTAAQTTEQLETIQFEQAKKAAGLDQLALLFVLGQKANSAHMRAAALAQIANASAPFEVWAARHALILQETRTLPLDPALAEFAPTFARAALLNADQELAQKWLQLSAPKAISANELGTGFYSIGGKIQLDYDVLLPPASAPAAVLRRAADHVRILMAVGAPLPANARHWLAQQPNEPSAPCPVNQQLALQQSAQAKAIGETILRAASLLRTHNFQSMPDQCGASIVRALSTVGRQDDAQKVAIRWLFSRLAHP